MVRKKGNDRNQEGFPISDLSFLSFIVLDSDKNIWMDLNQVYNMI